MAGAKTGWIAAIVGFAVGGAAMLLTEHLPLGKREERSALQAYDPGFGEIDRSYSPDASRSSPAPPFVQSNFIAGVEMARGESGPFWYWTGAVVRGGTSPSVPDMVTALVSLEHSTVEIKAHTGDAGHQQLAETVASAIDTIIKRFWPDESISVDVELHQVRPGHFGMARRIHWREGRPHYLTLFIDSTAEPGRQASIAVHELYHVLAIRWRLGGKAVHVEGSRWLATLHEEVTASLLADCSQLLRTQRLALAPPKVVVRVVHDDGEATAVNARLSAAQRADAINALSGKVPPSPLADQFHYTALRLLQPDGDEILIDDPSGAQLLELCGMAVQDPSTLEAWFRQHP